MMSDDEYEHDGSIDTILHEGGFFSMQRRAQRRRDTSDSIPVLLAEAALLQIMDKQVLKLIKTGEIGAGVWVVPSVAWVSPVDEVLTSWKDERAWVMERPDKVSSDDAVVAANFLSEGRSVMLVTANERAVPPVIRTTASHWYHIPRLTSSMVAMVIKKIAVGRTPAKLSSLELGDLDFSEIAAVLGQGGSAADMTDRLEQAIIRKGAASSANAVHLPDLDVAVEYGPARDWAMDLKADLDLIRRGDLTWEDADRGCLLTSEPGCGKSLFSLALGQYLRVPVVQTSMGALFASGPGYLDSVVKALRAAFDQAKAKAPSVLFIDEIDSIPSPDTADGKHDAWWRTVATEFLLLLDSATSDRNGVIVVGATNRAHAVHPSVLRPGRLERIIHIGPPDAIGAERVLRHHLRGDLVGIDISDIAQMAASESTTPAALMETVRAARRVARNARRPIVHADLLSRFRSAEDRSPEDLRTVAIHEAGHALLGALLAPYDIVASSIERGRNGSGGRLSIMFDHRPVTSRTEFLDRARIYLAGRAAEELVLQTTTLGSGGTADSDLGLATGLLAELHLSRGQGRQLRWRCSPDQAMAQLHQHPAVRVEVESELAELYQEVLALISGHRPALNRLTDSLLRHRTIDAETILSLVLDTNNYEPGVAMSDRRGLH